MNVVDVTALTARIYGRVFSVIRNAGTPIPLNDIWIAAATIESNGLLLTFDTDFKSVPDLAVTILH